MSMITEQEKLIKKLTTLAQNLAEEGCIREAITIGDAIDTIRQLAVKVREDNAYKKAFEDIRAEIIKWIEMGGGNYDYDSGLNRALSIIDKHNPAKMKSEGKE